MGYDFHQALFIAAILMTYFMVVQYVYLFQENRNLRLSLLVLALALAMVPEMVRTRDFLSAPSGILLAVALFQALDFFILSRQAPKKESPPEEEYRDEPTELNKRMHP